MKVAIEETVEVTDEQRTTLANVLDGKESKRKAQRTEAREFIWGHGSDWATVLDRAWRDRFGSADPDEGYDEEEDLLGTSEPEPDEDGEGLIAAESEPKEDEELIAGFDDDLIGAGKDPRDFQPQASEEDDGDDELI